METGQTVHDHQWRVGKQQLMVWVCHSKWLEWTESSLRGREGDLRGVDKIISCSTESLVARLENNLQNSTTPHKTSGSYLYIPAGYFLPRLPVIGCWRPPVSHPATPQRWQLLVATSDSHLCWTQSRVVQWHQTEVLPVSHMLAEEKREGGLGMVSRFWQSKKINTCSSCYSVGSNPTLILTTYYFIILPQVQSMTTLTARCPRTKR